MCFTKLVKRLIPLHYGLNCPVNLLAERTLFGVFILNNPGYCIHLHVVYAPTASSGIQFLFGFYIFRIRSVF